MLLRVTGKTFCAGTEFKKIDGIWQIKWIAPYLKKVIGTTPVDQIGDLLRRKGLRYSWIR